MENPILVTGCAGFIGAGLVNKFLANNENVIGIDNLNDYYDVNLKKSRLANIYKFVNEKKVKSNFLFKEISLEDSSGINAIFDQFKPKVVVNLAAQAGVRYSIENPATYIQSNIVGFANILESCRNYKVENLIYASSSSVYGGNRNLPFSELQSVNHPVSLYAATKKSNELMAHTYSHLYDLPTTGLRYFTVYGPWGRPDMAPMLFANAILNNKEIKVYNFGEMMRDFTYIDDIVEGTFKCCYKKATPHSEFDTLNPNPAISFAPHRIFNIGNSQPIKLLDFIEILENEFGKKANKVLVEMPPGDVMETAADTMAINDWVDFAPKTSIGEGIKKFADWYKSYYQI